jgi:hypothetical protein
MILDFSSAYTRDSIRDEQSHTDPQGIDKIKPPSKWNSTAFPPRQMSLNAQHSKHENEFYIHNLNYW